MVDQKNWLSEEDFSNVLAVTQSAPGALAVNASVFIGYNLAGFPGAMVSGSGHDITFFPGYPNYRCLFTQFSSLPVVQSMFNGIRPAVVALIATLW